MLALPNITIVCIDTIAQDLARLALEDTLDLVWPGAILLFSDSTKILPRQWENLADRRLIMSNPQSLLEVANILWYQVPRYVNTSHFLVMQWDGWVINPGAWRQEFLDYDYIGAVWHWHKDNRVGNGGFSLRSSSLARYIMGRASRDILQPWEDDVLCRTHRDHLEKVGFYWAPEEFAQEFSREHCHSDGVPFGFHDMRNWHRYLTEEQIEKRIKLANPYVMGKLGFRDLAKAYA